MPRLFDRRIELQVGPLKITDHEVQFDVQSTLTSDPNEATVHIYNLKEEDRKKVESTPKNAQLQIRAGYADPGPVGIYTGNTKRVFTERNGPDIITTVESADSFAARSPDLRLDKSYAAGSNLRTVVQDLVAACQAKIGNIGVVFGDAKFIERFDAPYHASGPAWDQLVKIVQSRDYTITTQGGVLQLITRRPPPNLSQLSRTAPLLSPTTGLIGTPSIDEEGVLTASCLMRPGILPGSIISLQSEFVSGTFRVTSTVHKGSLYGQEFGVDIEAKPGSAEV